MVESSRVLGGGVSRREKPGREARPWLEDFRKHWSLYLMALPGVLALLIFSYGPMFGVSIAFVDYSPVRGILNSEWVGLSWFRMAFQHPLFWPAVRNTVIIKGLQTIIGYPSAIILALLLNEVRLRWFKSIVQTATILPYFISWIIVGSMWKNLLGTSGVVNEVLQHIFGLEAVHFLSDPVIFRWVIVLQDTWKFCGYFAVLYLAAMVTIDPALYEAAMVDGANRWQQTWHVTLPGIRPTMVTILILVMGYLVIGSFEQVYVMYSVSVYSTADIIETLTFRLGLGQTKYSLATAVGLFQGILAFGLVMLTNQLVKRFGEEGLL
ncbi:MAG: ABC transporter permease subunit [Candidatus Hadarchaeum sp.]